MTKEMLLPLYYFDLTQFAYPELFNDDQEVWASLDLIPKVLDSNGLGRVEVNVPRGTTLENPEQISIGKNTTIEAGAYIRGPCIIGANCTIRHGAYIRGNVITGDGCVIGHATEIKNSILLNNAHAAHFAYLGDSILGNEVNLGAGVKCANLKLNNQEVSVTFEGERIGTGRRKLGAIIGDRAQLGCNAVTNPGTLMGKESSCHPCMNIGGFTPAGKHLHPEKQPFLS